MNLPKPFSAELQNGRSLTHCGVDLAGVPDIKAQGGVRKEPEDLRKMGNGLAYRLALVHILDTNSVIATLRCIQVTIQRFVEVLISSMRIERASPSERRLQEREGKDIFGEIGEK